MHEYLYITKVHAVFSTCQVFHVRHHQHWLSALELRSVWAGAWLYILASCGRLERTIVTITCLEQIHSRQGNAECTHTHFGHVHTC